MSIWVLGGSNILWPFIFDDVSRERRDAAYDMLFELTPAADEWVKHPVTFDYDKYPEDRGKPIPEANFRKFYSSLTCDQEAKRVLESLVRDKMEFLPLRWGEETIYAMHVVFVSQCVTYEHIRNYPKVDIDNNCLNNEPIFRVQGTAMYVNEVFKKTVEESRLVGLVFREP